MARTSADGSCYVVTDPAHPLDINSIASIGATNDSPPGTDTGTGTVIGLLKRVAQNVTSLIALFPTSLGGTTGANSLSVTLSTDEGLPTNVGAKADSVATTDTGTFSQIALIKRVAQNITGMSAKLPAALGPTTASASVSVTMATDDAVPVNLGAKADSAASTDTGTFSLIALIKKVASNITTMSGKLPAALGSATSANSLSVTLASDEGLVGIKTETAPANDTASSGLNGRLQRIAQRITSLMGQVPATLGQTTMSGSMSVVVASDNVPKTKGNLSVVEFTPTLDTSAYAAGDILFTTTAITNVFDANGGSAVLNTVVINDKDDQGIGVDLFFFRANTSIGTINVAPSITDAGADDIIGKVSVANSDWFDLGGCRVAVPPAQALVLKTGAATTSLWVAGVTKGTPTHTASGWTIKLGFLDKT